MAKTVLGYSVSKLIDKAEKRQTSPEAYITYLYRRNVKNSRKHEWYDVRAQHQLFYSLPR